MVFQCHVERIINHVVAGLFGVDAGLRGFRCTRTNFDGLDPAPDCVQRFPKRGDLGFDPGPRGRVLALVLLLLSVDIRDECFVEGDDSIFRGELCLSDSFVQLDCCLIDPGHMVPDKRLKFAASCHCGFGYPAFGLGQRHVVEPFGGHRRLTDQVIKLVEPVLQLGNAEQRREPDEDPQ